MQQMTFSLEQQKEMKWPGTPVRPVSRAALQLLEATRTDAQTFVRALRVPTCHERFVGRPDS